jgi:ferredoxin
MPRITKDCIGCSVCAEMCPAEAIEPTDNYQYRINQKLCVNCGQCKQYCDHGAIVWV